MTSFWLLFVVGYASQIIRAGCHSPPFETWYLLLDTTRWVDLFQQYGPVNAPGVLLGNKADLRNRCVEHQLDTVKSMVRENGKPFFLFHQTVSALSGMGSFAVFGVNCVVCSVRLDLAVMSDSVSFVERKTWFGHVVVLLWFD